MTKKDILYPLRRFHGWLHEQKRWLQEDILVRREVIPRIRQALREQPDAVLLLMTPAHTNMGDHAIAWSETELLRKAGIPFIELTGRELFRIQRHHLLHILNGRTVLMNGGGYLGTLWYIAEDCTREIMQRNPDSPIVILPNTFYYEDSPWGKKELKASVKIYNAHPNLHIFAREKTSYENMKSLYKNVQLMPDMVLSLDEYRGDALRKGCLVCLRNDHERTRTEAQEREILQQIHGLFGDDVLFSDMCIDHDVSPDTREAELTAKFDEFRSAELVVTDRLHAMIFAAITGTPCIVVDSRSPKVRGCYEWISHLDYIRFADSPEQISGIYRQIPEGEHRFDNTSLKAYYDDLANTIRELNAASASRKQRH